MKPAHNLATRKRPVNLTLNEEVVTRAKSLTSNLSGVVESLLMEYIAREQQNRAERTKMVESAMTTWNQFNCDNGSIADEYGTL